MFGKRFQSFFDSSNRRHDDSLGDAVDQNSHQLGNDDSDYYSSGYGSSHDSYEAPLRFIIIRHGERVDVVHGRGWTQRAFDASGQYHPFDSNMPPVLPFRPSWRDYDVDTPLTAKGLSQSWNVGNVLARFNLPVTACYSSPAFRSIQTADRILEGMGRKSVIPVRLELGLFECTSWYARSPINFMSDPDLLTGGYNIDTQYRSQISNLRIMENEYQYYDRSKETMEKIVRLHKKTGGIVLLVAHAPSLEVLTRHLMKGQPRPERLAELSGKVDFCSMTVIEKDGPSSPWQFCYSLDKPTSAIQWQKQRSSQVEASNNPSTGAFYQPPTTFSHFHNHTNATANRFHLFPPQEAYPPYFVI